MSEVIWFSSDEAGAPVLTTTSSGSVGTAGAVIGVLDACLINGFNAKSVTSIVVASGVATVTVSAHGYKLGRKVLHAGATSLTGVNGVKKILSTTSNTYTFDATGVADGSATGTITAKRAPLGWVKTFGDSTHAVYSRTDLAASSQVLAINDSDANLCRVWGAASASDISTYVGKFPTDAQNSGGDYWTKRGSGAGTALPWVLVGDGLSFYFFPAVVGSPAVPAGFGDLVSYRAGDLYKSFLGSARLESASYFLGGLAQSASAGVPLGFGFICRDTTGIGNSTPMANMTRGFSYSGGATQPIYPSIVDNGLVIEDRMLVLEANALMPAPIRGHYPGIAEPIARISAAAHGTLISGVEGSDRTYLVQYIQAANNTATGGVLIDITGPWQ